MTVQTGAAYQRIIDALDHAGKRFSYRNATRAQAQCPAHEDNNPSLSIKASQTVDGDGSALVTCRAGCQTVDVMAALGMQMRDLFDNQDRLTWQYEDGRLVKKTYKSDGKKKFWQDNANGRACLYNLTAVKKAVAEGVQVILVEGEKDADAVNSIGGVGTSAPMGAANVDKCDLSPLHGGKVLVVRDLDAAGEGWVQQIKTMLEGKATLEWGVPKEGKDPADHVAAGHGIADFLPPRLDGVQLLNRVRRWFARYIATVSNSDLDLLTLWAVHTHLVEETYTTPRLVIDSPVPGSGKTTCLEHLQRLSRRSVQMAAVSSPALLVRMLDVELRTILIDEADRSLDPKKEGIADLVAVLNSGYKRGGTRPVLVQGKGNNWLVKEMSTFAPVAMAGNNPQLPEDTMQRSIRVLLLPNDTIHESDWELIEADALALHLHIRKWSEQVRTAVASDRPDMPEGIQGRNREKWQPLKRVAVAAGGDWPERVDKMAIHDKEDQDMDREEGLIRERPAVVLIKHIQQVWPADQEFIGSQELITMLVTHDPDMWGEHGQRRSLTVQRLGKMLVQSFKIRSDREFHRAGTRGYFFQQFAPALHHLGIEVVIEPEQPVQTEQPEQPTEGICAVCGHPMRITEPGQTTHPNC